MLEALNALRERFGPELEHVLFDGDRPRKNFSILVNGRNIRFLAEFDTKVGNGDCITIIPQIAGGALGAGK